MLRFGKLVGQVLVGLVGVLVDAGVNRAGHVGEWFFPGRVNHGLDL